MRFEAHGAPTPWAFSLVVTRGAMETLQALLDGQPHELRPALTKVQARFIQRSQLVRWQPEADVWPCGIGIVEKAVSHSSSKTKRPGEIAEARTGDAKAPLVAGLFSAK
ncbi:hypothetical protein ACVL92_000744 [Bradyrhizobium liaoningense]|nr:hypothetical protein [Bradyrhizobium liaoningense]